jgi:hypothetical protein
LGGNESSFADIARSGLAQCIHWINVHLFIDDRITRSRIGLLQKSFWKMKKFILPFNNKPRIEKAKGIADRARVGNALASRREECAVAITPYSTSKDAGRALG